MHILYSFRAFSLYMDEILNCTMTWNLQCAAHQAKLTAIFIPKVVVPLATTPRHLSSDGRMSVHSFSGDKSVLTSMRDISDQCDSLRHMFLPQSVGAYTKLFLLLSNVILMTFILMMKLFKSLYTSFFNSSNSMLQYNLLLSITLFSLNHAKVI